MANKKVQKAGKAAQTARSNPYVQRLIDDEDLRKNIVQAYESARDAYSRLSNGKSPTKQIFDDRKLQKHIKEAAGNVRDDVAMTGELTLTGQVLPIGGLKEKALAAQRAGVKRVLAPRRNEADLEDFPEHLREGMEFVWVGEISEVFDAALDGR